ncbi:MAG: dihydroorotate oxidase [Flavobacteriales bacterium]
MPTIETNVGQIPLRNCLYNASGARCTTGAELDALAGAHTGAVLAKSTTVAYRKGNPEPRYRDIPFGSINSMGLPNLGVDFYLNYAEGFSGEKPLFLSVAGLTSAENCALLKRIQNAAGVTAVELNLSCPNIPGKPQTGYDFEQTERLLQSVFEFYDKPLGVKLPPYFDRAHFDQMAAVLNRFPLAFVTCINSMGNGLHIDVRRETPSLKPKGGFGGIGGLYAKPTALANVNRFYKLLDDIPIIGCGGVQTGTDVFEHILCGARAVQVGTCLMKEGTSCFTRLAGELESLMREKGYARVADFTGQLKSL